MTTQDERSPRPTDPPIEPIVNDLAPDTADDTEGHGLLDAELGRQINREHVREADRIARDGARVREVRKGRDGGFLKRFSRR